ncbi:nucleotide disphospho-sugar-binding domain-containing protein [Streptomyces sp. NPDC050421]|uniref:nucleotide disphospho-sugar-binding domain-containing protein n=1 Tax=unclassified Streptomyces TaxID=2593676 RepID=UPI0037A058D7
MKVLMIALVQSHLLPMVPTAWALQAAGHDVVLAGAGDVTEAGAAAGLSTITVGREQAGFQTWHRRVHDRTAAPGGPGGPGGPEASGTPDAPGPWADLAVAWRTRVAGVIEEYLGIAEAWKPDLVLTDPIEFCGLITGGVLGIPTVAHRWGPDAMETILREPVRAALGDLCAGLGLRTGMPAADLIVDPCPPGLQVPGLAPASPMRFVPYNGTGEIPQWTTRRATEERRILVSLGRFGMKSVSDPGQDGWAVVRSLLAAVRDRGDTEVLLPVPAEARSGLGPVPDGVRVIDPVPLSKVLRTCDAVVHHGGTGSALTATWAGLPQLALPLAHPALIGCAQRIAATGAGIALTEPERQGDPDELRAALAAVLEEPEYREGAVRLREEMRTQPSLAAVVGELEQLEAGSANRRERRLACAS